jgi:two-component system phosphate regulon response regulator OmpR
MSVADSAITTADKRGPRALIVDDDEKLGALLAEYLGRFGWSVRGAVTADEGLRALAAEAPDIVILDVMLPGTDGFEVCRRIRQSSGVPIVMLTARGDVMDRIVGLELGADDYLPKPFEPRELLARMQAVLRRGATSSGAPYGASSGVVVAADERVRCGPLEVSFSTCTVKLDGRPVWLTSAELELLFLLVRNRGRVLSRDRILDETRGIDWESFDRSIDVLVSRLRQKLSDDPRQPRFVRTVRGVGYSFIGGDDG